MATTPLCWKILLKLFLIWVRIFLFQVFTCETLIPLVHTDLFISEIRDVKWKLCLLCTVYKQAWMLSPGWGSFHFILAIEKSASFNHLDSLCNNRKGEFPSEGKLLSHWHMGRSYPPERCLSTECMSRTPNTQKIKGRWDRWLMFYFLTVLCKQKLIISGY